MKILYVEDDPGLGDLLSKHLHARNHSVTVVGGIRAAQRALGSDRPDVVLCDHDLPDGAGLELMEAVLAADRALPCIMLTGVGNEALAVSAMKAGARDYIVKDIENNFLSLVPVIIDRIGREQNLERGLLVAERENSRLEARNRYLSTNLKKQTAKNTPIGQHSSFKRLQNTIEQVAPTDATVLITGETGTGKEMAAQLIHEMSPRADKPFITVNCAALPPQLVESELFGHEKGAFTGAISSHTGRFEAADGGTLFLDEVGELPIELQPKLLRVLQESIFQRVGGSGEHCVDVRLIAATNQNLSARVADKTFREDLYYRLNVIPVHVPPLRQRRTDIELLFMHFVRRFSDRHGLTAPDTTEVLKMISGYAWPGNVRELSNYVERGIVMQHWEQLPVTTTAEQPKVNGDTTETQELTLDEVERIHIVKVLRRTQGLVGGGGGAAEILGLHANTLRSRMKKLGIIKPEFSL